MPEWLSAAVFLNYLRFDHNTITPEGVVVNVKVDLKVKVKVTASSPNPLNGKS